MRIHFIGIGGIGVSALAQYYLAKGHEVSGSDLVFSEITEALKKKGATIFKSKINSKFKIQNSKLPNLVIYSPAVPKNHPELKMAKRLRIECLSYPEALGRLTKQYFTIAVSGTHGKSTTTAMIALILIKAGLDPTVIIGTKLKEFGGSNFRLGRKSAKILNTRSKILVIEADEHMASFLNYWPKVIVLTNIEADHLDYYKSLKNILKAFKKYISRLPKDGILVANKDDPQTNNILFTIVNKALYFSRSQKEAKKLRELLKVPGEHNITNALAALSTARALGVPDKIIYKALAEFKGTWRRFEEKEYKIQGTRYKIRIISDYAHHPTEIKATLKAAREKYPQKTIFCVFQPHQYQRTYYLWKDFIEVFRQASKFIEKIIITDIYDVAGRENVRIKRKINSQKLVKAINKPNIIYVKKEDILKYLRSNLVAGEALIFMGAGDIYKLTEARPL